MVNLTGDLFIIRLYEILLFLLEEAIEASTQLYNVLTRCDEGWCPPKQSNLKRGDFMFDLEKKYWE